MIDLYLSGRSVDFAAFFRGNDRVVVWIMFSKMLDQKAGYGSFINQSLRAYSHKPAKKVVFIWRKIFCAHSALHKDGAKYDTTLRPNLPCHNWAKQAEERRDV